MSIKYIYPFLFVGLFTLMSCDKETPVLYEVGLEAEFDISVGLNTIETHYFIIRNVPTFYNQFASQKGIDTSSIKSIVASRGLLTGKFQSIDYDFISRISIYAVSRIDPNNKREMYYLDQVPITTDTELRMLSSSTQLKEILRDEFIDIEVRLNFRTFPTSNLRTKIVFGYAVI